MTNGGRHDAEKLHTRFNFQGFHSGSLLYRAIMTM